jgi:Ca-activated chloride channel family protein
MDQIHRRIGAPLVTGLSVVGDGIELLADTVSPSRLPDLFPGAPVVFTGRFRGAPAGALVVRGRDREGEPWQARVEGAAVDGAAVRPTWARAHLRDLEDRYATRKAGQDLADLERRIVETSLRFGVLCRFTAFVAVDSRVVTDGSGPHRVTQPVEPAAGWDMLRPRVMAEPGAAMTTAGPAGAVTLAAMTSPMATESTTAGAAMTFQGPRAAMARTTRSRSGTGGPRPGEARDDVRTLAGLELRRLRAASGAPEYERRQLLDDLATRLSALVAELAAREVADLVAAIRSGREDLDELWARALRVLEELARPAGGAADPAGGAAGSAGSAADPTGSAPDPAARRSRTPFWKR